MNKPTFRLVAEAFTLVELLVLLAGVVILVALLLPAMVNSPSRPPFLPCMQNLRQVGLALQMFADDNNGQFPPRLSITNGGSMELIGSNSPALHFLTLSNYLTRNGPVFHCPADAAKERLTNNSALTDRNVSYFLSVDATPRMTNAILAGDRNLEVAGQAVRPGLYTLATSAAVGWTGEMHSKRGTARCGDILFADGHVQFLRTNLTSVIQRQGLATNRLAVP